MDASVTHRVVHLISRGRTSSQIAHTNFQTPLVQTLADTSVPVRAADTTPSSSLFALPPARAAQGLQGDACLAHVPNSSGSYWGHGHPGKDTGRPSREHRQAPSSVYDA